MIAIKSHISPYDCNQIKSTIKSQVHMIRGGIQFLKNRMFGFEMVIIQWYNTKNDFWSKNPGF